MQVVIEISEKAYSYIKREWVENDFDSPMIHAMNGIKKGTPLPKGHGRLIDADRLLRPDMIRMCYHLKNGDTAMPIIDIEHAETVIPADKENEE